jgi:hypothetical protein
MIDARSPATPFPMNLANGLYPVGRVLCHFPLDVFPLALRDNFAVRFPVDAGPFKLFSVVPSIPATAGQTTAF